MKKRCTVTSQARMKERELEIAERKAKRERFAGVHVFVFVVLY